MFCKERLLLLLLFLLLFLLFGFVLGDGGVGGPTVYYQTHRKLTNKKCLENTGLSIPPDPNV